MQLYCCYFIFTFAFCNECTTRLLHYFQISNYNAYILNGTDSRTSVPYKVNIKPIIYTILSKTQKRTLDNGSSFGWNGTSIKMYVNFAFGTFQGEPFDDYNFRDTCHRRGREWSYNWNSIFNKQKPWKCYCSVSRIPLPFNTQKTNLNWICLSLQKIHIYKKEEKYRNKKN